LEFTAGNSDLELFDSGVLFGERANLARMGHRLSKIYTKTGDDGTTGLGDGTRVRKDAVRVEAFGTADELNSAIGVLLAVPGLPAAIVECLTEVQHELFDLGG
jgi:cob(I)alamin adenosyltransferase